MTSATVKKYLAMTEDDIQKLSQPKNCKKRTTVMDDYLNMIYKMLDDNIDPELIYEYVYYRGYQGSPVSLKNTYIYWKKIISQIESTVIYAATQCRHTPWECCASNDLNC